VPLPLEPPVPPMLAKLVDELPVGEFGYEPKLDGFRCLAFRDGDRVELQSRHGNLLTRYFPEVVAALPRGAFVVDGELVSADADFVALMARLHPAASRVTALAGATPARLVCFDLLASGGELLLDVPYSERRARLEDLLGDAVGGATRSRAEAAGWLAESEGVIAKELAARYEPGKRRWLKIKQRKTADCVVAGFRWRADRPLPSSLLLALYDDGALEHVGVAASFGVRRAAALLERLEPLVTPLEGHPWERGFLLRGGALGRLRGAAGRWLPGMTMDWTPVVPALVAEVTYDAVDDGRFRHPARFVRWRPDRDPASCSAAQLR
jgi:ATP-dependent DNA ligase